jgi:hypothetical protein
MTAAASILPVSGVYNVPLERIVALQTLGLLPRLSTSIEDLNRRHREREPLPAQVAPLQWWVSGDPFEPTAVMALMTRYDYGYNADVLEMVHIAGSRRGVDRLMRTARFLASMYQLPLTGEIDIANERMRNYLRRLNVFRPERERWTVAVDDLLEGIR